MGRWYSLRRQKTKTRGNERGTHFWLSKSSLKDAKVIQYNNTRAILVHGIVYTDGEMGATLEDIFIFCTGAPREPPLCLGQRMKLRFDHRSTLPTCSTCSLTLNLPTKMVEQRRECFNNLTLGFKSHNFLERVKYLLERL